MSNKAIEIYSQALHRQEEERHTQPHPGSKLKPTHKRDNLRDHSRNPLRKTSTDKVRNMTSDNPRAKSQDFPTRDDIQEFSFHLRDELEAKVQAEVPHQWRKELEEIAQHLRVKKLELYRFIFGEFLGKIQRKKNELEGDGKSR